MKVFYSQNNKIVWLTHFLRNSRGAQRFVGFFLTVLFGCWLAGKANSSHVAGTESVKTAFSLIAVWGSLSINALRASFYTIYIQQLSSFRAPTLWFIDLTVATCHIQCTFLSLHQFVSRENGQNTKILVIFRMMRNGHRRLLGAQSINTERTSLICTLPLSSAKDLLGFYLGPCICFGVKGSYKIQQSCRHESIESGLNWVLLFSVIQQRLCWPRIKRQL